MKVTITTLTGKKILLTTDENTEILHIKRIIEDAEGIPMEKQRLIVNGVDMADHEKITTDILLLTRCMSSTSTMTYKKYVEPHKEDIMQIFVKQLTGIAITLDVTPNTTIEVVKMMLAEIGDYEVEKLELVYAGKQLFNCKTLSDYNIKKEVTLHLCINIRGN